MILKGKIDFWTYYKREMPLISVNYEILLKYILFNIRT